ncbi:MAG: glutathione S-transferase family protein [Bradyrhizobiaceae bacterium]|nr:MAG: glutathione S-transferase family protein [Bradyrhizobiaceae bacterium]
MKFYDCLTAPSPRRVRMFLAEKGVTLETKMVDLANGEQLTDTFGEVNPRRTVPVLELDDGTKLLDSTAICMYLEDAFPDPNLMGRDPKERAVIAMWQRDIETNGTMAIMECFRNSSKGFRNRALTGPIDYEQIPALAERGRQRVRHFFAELNFRLSRSEYVTGDRFTIVDITAFVAVEFSRAIKEKVPDDAAHLKRWRDAVGARPSASV